MPTSKMSTSQSKHDLIESIQVKKNLLTVRANHNFKQRYLNDDFFVNYNENIDLENLDFTILSIPFIMSVISLIWESGTQYRISTMDEELFHALNVIKEVYKVFYPAIAWNGELIPDQLVTNAVEKRDDPLLGLLFSGGLDSIYTSLAHYPSRQLLITCFGFSSEIRAKKWNIVKQQCRQFADQFGHINSFIVSNFRSFINYSQLHERYSTMVPWIEYCQEAVSLAGVSAPILVLKGCTSFLISSSLTWCWTFPWGSHPFIDNNIRFSGVRATNDAPHLGRQEKLQELINLCNVNHFPRPKLYVCRLKNEEEPCCKCMKCLVTINGILLEGENPRDFGFCCSARTTQLRTKKIFQQRKIQDFYDELLWEYLQKSSKKSGKFSEEDEMYWSWFCSLDFSSYAIHPNRYTGKEINYQDYMYFLEN